MIVLDWCITILMAAIGGWLWIYLVIKQVTVPGFVGYGRFGGPIHYVVTGYIIAGIFFCLFVVSRSPLFNINARPPSVEQPVEQEKK